jgi:hypothetical protein
MSTKFVMFTNAHTRKPILVNSDHIVEGDLNSVWETLTKLDRWA